MKKWILYFTLLFCVFCSQKVWANISIPFEGQLNFAEDTLKLSFGNEKDNRVRGELNKIDSGGFRLNLDLDHIQTPFFEISTHLQSLITIEQDQASQTPFFRGTLNSQYSLFNRTPINELSGGFEFKNNIFYLKHVSYGDFSLDGNIRLATLPLVDLNLTINSIFMEDFLSFWIPGNEYSSSGIVSGVIKAQGPVDNIFLKGNLESKVGSVKSLAFDELHLLVEGNYPYMRILPSVISETNGMTFIFDGAINLADKSNFKKQLKNLNLSPLINDNDAQTAWTLRRQGGEEGVTELKYFLRKNSYIGSGQEDESDAMLGFERKMEF